MISKYLRYWPPHRPQGLADPPDRTYFDKFSTFLLQTKVDWNACHKKQLQDASWRIEPAELQFDDPPHVLGKYRPEIINAVIAIGSTVEFASPLPSLVEVSKVQVGRSTTLIPSSVTVSDTSRRRAGMTEGWNRIRLRSSVKLYRMRGECEMHWLRCSGVKKFLVVVKWFFGGRGGEIVKTSLRVS